MKSYIKDYARQSGAEIEITGIIPNQTMIFPAFLTTFTDNMTSNWSEEIVYGRPDPIGTFQNTTRKIALGFDLPSANIAEAKENLFRINTVKQFLYPAYSSNVAPQEGEEELNFKPSTVENVTGQNLERPEGSSPETAAVEKGVVTTTNALSLSKSPLIRIKLANLIQNQGGEGLLGWIGSFSATPVIDMGMFNESKNLFPKVYNVSIDFTPQHEFDLGYKSDGKMIETGKFIQFPYIGGTPPKARGDR